MLEHKITFRTTILKKDLNEIDQRLSCYYNYSISRIFNEVGEFNTEDIRNMEIWNQPESTELKLALKEF